MLPKPVTACLAATAARRHSRTDAYRRVRWTWRGSNVRVVEMAALY